MAPDERRLLVPQFENLDEYRTRKVQVTTQEIGSMHPAPGVAVSDELGPDFDFSFDLGNDSAGLTGQEQGCTGTGSSDDPVVVVDHESGRAREKDSTRNKRLDDIFFTTDAETFDPIK